MQNYIVFDNHHPDEELREDTHYCTFKTLQEALYYIDKEAMKPAVIYKKIENVYKPIVTDGRE